MTHFTFNMLLKLEQAVKLSNRHVLTYSQLLRDCIEINEIKMNWEIDISTYHHTSLELEQSSLQFHEATP